MYTVSYYNFRAKILITLRISFTVTRRVLKAQNGKGLSSRNKSGTQQGGINRGNSADETPARRTSLTWLLLYNIVEKLYIFNTLEFFASCLQR